MKLLGYTFGEKIENKVSTRSDASSLKKVFLEQQKFRMREDLKTLEDAIDNRDNIVNFNREDIHRIYRKALQDSHIASQWKTRKLKTLKKEFFVMPENSEEPNEELTEVLMTPWFYKFISDAMDSLAWGFSLVEFGIWNDEKKTFEPYRANTQIKKGRIHEDVEVIERDNVKPEYGIVVNTPGESEGVDFTKDKFKKQLIFVGGKDNGWLYDAAKPYLIKDNTVKNWSEFAELFGMDIRFFQTDATGEDLTKAKAAMKNAVGGGTMIAGVDDNLEYIGTGRSDAYQVFMQLVDYQDKTLSKLIFGQDVISNNTGRVVGEVGENVANVYAESDGRFIKYIIEERLFPLLTANGLSFEGHTFEWGTKEQLSLTERADIDLKISQMGFAHSNDYINETYDTNVENSESASLTETQNALKELYGSSKTNIKVR